MNKRTENVVYTWSTDSARTNPIAGGQTANIEAICILKIATSKTLNIWFSEGVEVDSESCRSSCYPDIIFEL